MNHALRLGHLSVPHIRAHHVIAVVAVVVIGLGAKQFLFPPKQAEANITAISNAGIDVFQLQNSTDTKNLPVHKMTDNTFVFPNEE